MTNLSPISIRFDLIGDGVVNGHIYQQLSLDAVVHAQREPETGKKTGSSVIFPSLNFSTAVWLRNWHEK